MIKSLVLVAMLYTPQEDSVSNEVYMASLHIIKDVMETKKNCKFNKRKMKTYYIGLESGDATVYASSKQKAITSFILFVRKWDNRYTMEKDKDGYNLYWKYNGSLDKVDVNEVTKEGVITYVQH
jgi:hypothetical protein